ncbi:MAG: hypothetical protein ACREAY_01390 [Nitrososphaera sp.]|uniref:hypothetical protein n=1 Tax=Nitrososphaera sp. TaxID=1971748 RepID=UPI003D6ECFC6
MYFAGHMALAYLASRVLPKASFSLPLVFAAAMLPDMDFLFYQFFPHHTITHSLTFWSVLYAPVFAVFRRRAIPYAIATFSHFMIGALLTGNPPLLFGISDARLGAPALWLFAQHGAPYVAIYQAAVEAAMVALFLALSYRSLKSVWSGAHDPRHVLVLLAVVALVFFGALRGEVVAALKQPQEMLYLAYGMAGAAQAAFLLPFIRPLAPKKLQANT